MSPRLPLPSPESKVPGAARIADMNLLAPKFRAKIKALLSQMEAKGHRAIVYETKRTNERQQYLYGFGRDYDDGRGKVTNAKEADDGWHFFCLAVDIICAVRQWNATEQFWTDLRIIATSLGLRSGADWDMDGDCGDERLLDRPHVQWGPPMRVSPSPSASRLYAEGGIEAVWKAVNAA